MDEQQMRQEWQVGGHERELSAEEQLAQLSSYIYAHYEQPEKNPPWSENPSDPADADTYDARLADRSTHAAMIMLGAAVDHSTPGVAFARGVDTTDVPEVGGTIIRPEQPSGAWGISLHPGGWWKGSGVALENAWRPEVAAVANLSGVTFLDLDYPLVPEYSLPDVIASVRKAAEWIKREQEPSSLVGWGYSSGGALAVLSEVPFDRLALTFPHLDLSMLPGDVRQEVKFPKQLAAGSTLIQVASQDAIAGRYQWAEQQAEVREYVSEHRLSTPAVARERVRDVAKFLG
ncbi:alpha/beta hydrolase [Corynebacterium gerontici]|uniref:Alpha/beta hydrolase fold protein n=1 Tax=Corynebacterium gerontici TaxID=2079234 RepID=A0A3G6J237_9CORY|nr:alpha/beta hydrolase [Corynebacterium gerontici]AZA10450.1 alpha/beta hydrolase fold protein [Corynebacterium gerontici]